MRNFNVQVLGNSIGDFPVDIPNLILSEKICYNKKGRVAYFICIVEISIELFGSKGAVQIIVAFLNRLLKNSTVPSLYAVWENNTTFLLI